MVFIIKILESEDKKEEETKEEEKADEKAEGKKRPWRSFKMRRFLTPFLAPKRKAEEKDEDEPAEKK